MTKKEFKSKTFFWGEIKSTRLGVWLFLFIFGSMLTMATALLLMCGLQTFLACFIWGSATIVMFEITQLVERIESRKKTNMKTEPKPSEIN